MMNSLETTRGRALLEAVPLALILGLLLWQAPLDSGHRVAPVSLRLLEAETAADLAQAFATLDYRWPPPAPVPALAAPHLPRDLAELQVDQRKQLFFQTLLPLVLAENLQIRRQRRFLKSVFAAPAVRQDSPAGQRVERLARRYGVEGDLNDPSLRQELLRRVDEVPVALALAQAAKESGWGTSRFATQANNLFGQWTWRADQGMVPAQRRPGARHRVRVFADLRSAVRAYLHNLNVGHAYADLRRLRAELRSAERPLDPVQLAGGLERYSSRGATYVRELRAMIRSNELDALGPLELAQD